MAATSKTITTNTGTFAQIIRQTVEMNGDPFSIQRTGTAYTTQIDLSAILAAAKIGSLTTRTDNDTGELTMNAGHGITTGARLDVYWTLASVTYQRRGMTVGTVATNAVPIDGGTGDVLPAAATAVTAMVPELFTLPVSLTEANVKCFGASISNITAPCIVSLGGGSYTEQTAFTLADSDGTWDTSIEWSDTYGGTSPISPGVTITQMYVSHGDSGGAGSFKMKIGY